MVVYDNINGILDFLSENIKRMIPDFKKSVHLARIDEEGRVLIQSDPTQNEFKWAGLSDTEGNYFYIRHRDEGNIFYEEAVTAPKTSCSYYIMNIRYELRLVAVLKNACAYTLENTIRDTMISIKFPNQNTIKNIRFIPTKSVIDSIQVLREESPKTKAFDKNMMFVAIDFDLGFEKHYI